MRTILITGASSGIGRATALALAKESHHLILAARRLDALHEVAEEARGLGATTTVLKLELARGEGFDLVAKALARSEGYPVLVNNAGFAEFGEFASLRWDRIEEMIQVNLTSPARLCHGFVPVALARGGGQIINILSMVVTNTLPYSSAYAAAKAGLLQLGRVLAAENRRKGLKVTAILPGAVNTPIWDGMNIGLNRADMIPSEAVASLIRDLIEAPLDRNVDEVTIMPPKGKL